MRLRFAMVLGLVALLAGAALGGQASGRRPLRAIYIGQGECTDEMLPVLRDMGIETLFCVYNDYDLEQLKPTLADAKRHRLRLIWTMFFHGGPEIERGFANNPRRFVREDGTITQRTTCPLDPVYWEAAAGERAVALARLAKDDPTIEGIAYDVEMYGGASDYGWDQYCVCDWCFGGFLRARANIKVAPTTIARRGRKAWLEKRGLWPAYQQYEHAAVRQICADIRTRAQALAPDFAFYVLPYGDLYSKDIGAGFGTARAPCVMMPEDTYSAGYKTDVEASQIALDRQGVPIRFALGLWAFRRAPQEWSTLAYLSATRVGGYWFYNEFPWSKVFIASTPEEREKYKLQGTPEEWREAITRCNREIDRRLADPAYAPDLPLLALRRPDYPIDFASLAVSVRVPSQARPFTAAGLFWKGRFVEIAARKTGDEATFTLPPGYSGPYRVKTRLLRGPDCGTVQVLVGGKPVGAPIDCYYPIIAPGGDEPDAQARLPAEMRLTLRVVGKNPRSTGYRIGADCMYLDYAGPFCSDWMIIGPFPNPEHAGFETAYPPEKEIQLDAGYPGLDGEARWQQAAADASGLVDFLDAYGGKERKREWAVAYALTHVYSPRARTALLLLGSDDGCKVWLNGKLAWSVLARRGSDADRDRFAVGLRRGWNRVLVKVEQGTGEWGLRVRLTDPDGTLRCSAAAP